MGDRHQCGGSATAVVAAAAPSKEAEGAQDLRVDANVDVRRGDVEERGEHNDAIKAIEGLAPVARRAVGEVLGLEENDVGGEGGQELLGAVERSNNAALRELLRLVQPADDEGAAVQDA